MEDLDERLKSIERELSSIRTELTRYKGFVGGVVFIVTALGAVIELFGKKIGL
jgi:hypothetical protein